MRCLPFLLACALFASADQMTYDRAHVDLGDVELCGLEADVLFFPSIADPIGCLERWRGRSEILVSIGDCDGVPPLDKLSARGWVLTDAGALEPLEVERGNLGEGMYGPGVGFGFADDGTSSIIAVVIELDGVVSSFRLPGAPDACPACGATCVEIVYGKPGAALIERAEAGEVFLGGCDLREERWHCPACNTDH